MYRRGVSLLLLPCVLLTQAAGLAHGHGGHEPPGHNLRPHLHLNPPPAAGEHSHGHHHGPGGHHHHHHGKGDDIRESDTQPMPRREPWSEHEHDTDAVYIDRVDAVLDRRSTVPEESATSLLWIDQPNLPAAIFANPAREVQRRSHPPPALGDPCPLFIRHLALLI